MSSRASGDSKAPKAFQRQVFITRDDLLAARWWHEGMQGPTALAPSRRSALSALLKLGGLVAAGALLRKGCDMFSEPPAITMDALDLQRKEGWAVGTDGQTLDFPGRSSVDSADNAAWAKGLDRLGPDLAPTNPALEPYAVNTLFDVFNNPRGAGLVQIISPMFNSAMRRAHEAAQALATLFAKEEDGKQTALILDMPGPESVAAAAGVADIFSPVFLYDNWPHPLGVVPSHETLAAAVFFRPMFLVKSARRPDTASPAFVLDSLRLSPYRDESDRFDNRYLAKMPSADNLGKLGIKRILYVTATAQTHEMDDLNDDFVAFKDKDIDVRMIALSDFAPASEDVLHDNRLPPAEHRYFYGGHPNGSYYFWSSYHWYSPTLSGHSLLGIAPRPVSAGHSFSPVSRPTMFSSRTIGGISGVGKQKPSGFGRVSYRSGGGSSGRSGSFGRIGSSSFG